MSSKKDTSTEERAPEVEAGDDTVLTLAAIREQALQLDPEGVTVWSPESGFHFVGRTLECDYEDMDYRGVFALIGGFTASGPQVIDA